MHAGGYAVQTYDAGMLLLLVLTQLLLLAVRLINVLNDHWSCSVTLAVQLAWSIYPLFNCSPLATPAQSEQRCWLLGVTMITTAACFVAQRC